MKKKWENLNREELAAVVSWFETDVFINTIAPLLTFEEEADMEQVLYYAATDDKVNGAIAAGGVKKLRWLVSMHDRAMEELEKIR